MSERATRAGERSPEQDEESEKDRRRDIMIYPYL